MSIGKYLKSSLIHRLAYHLTRRSFVDRDMLMRYYWGLAIGHQYAHNQRDGAASANSSTEADDNIPLRDLDSHDEPYPSTGDEPEFSLDNLEDDVIPEEREEDEDNLAASDHDDVDADEYLNMYG